MREQYFTPEEVADRLGVRARTVREWLRTGKLGGVKAGRLWRVRERDLQAFLERSPQQGKSQEDATT